MKRILALAIVLVAVVLPVLGCAPQGTITLKGELNKQSIRSRWAYSVATYTISSRDELITLRVRDGWELIVGETYEFILRHIEDGEYVAVSIEQLTCECGIDR